MSFRERLARTRELAWMKAAYRMPRRLRYWGIIHETVAYSQAYPGDEVPAIAVTDVLAHVEMQR